MDLNMSGPRVATAAKAVLVSMVCPFSAVSAVEVAEVLGAVVVLAQGLLVAVRWAQALQLEAAARDSQ